MTDRPTNTQKQATSIDQLSIEDMPVAREHDIPDIWPIEWRTTKLESALGLFHLAQCDKALDESAWDDLVVNWTSDDMAAVEALFPRRTWPEMLPYPNLVAYARYVNGYSTSLWRSWLRTLYVLAVAWQKCVVTASLKKSNYPFLRDDSYIPGCEYAPYTYS